MKLIRLFKIKWDTEVDGKRPSAKSLDLPTECVRRVEDNFNPNEQAADLLSDEFGYCVFAVAYQWLHQLTREEAQSAFRVKRYGAVRIRDPRTQTLRKALRKDVFERYLEYFLADPEK